MLLGYILFLNYKWTRGVLNLITYTIVNSVFFVLFVWNTSKGALLSSLTGLINKDITFTGRTSIWEGVKPYICQHWLLGNGLEQGKVMAEKIGMIQAVNAHNLYLDLVYKTGLSGFLLIAFLFVLTCSKIRKIEDPKIRYFLEAFIGIFMFMSQFEAYSIKFIFFMLVFLYMYGCKNSGAEEEKRDRQEQQIENKIYNL